MNSNLLNAILAMDSYNRGYDEGISGLGGIGSQIGTVTISNQSDTDKDSTGVEADFYAIAYKTQDGEIIISYRGTDNKWSDMSTGWLSGLGDPALSQVRLAFEFYNTIVNSFSEDVDQLTANISLTGHSLGGGLAGLVGAVYGKEACLFDNMAFELSADRIYNAFLIQDEYNSLTDPAIYGDILNKLDGVVYNDPSNVVENDLSSLYGFSISGEALVADRVFFSVFTS